MVEIIQKLSTEIFKDVKLMERFSNEELQKILAEGKTMKAEAHTNIVIEGECSWGVFFILEGTVGIYKSNQLTGDMYEVAQIKSGGFFGEMSLIDTSPRSATVKAVTPCTFYYISKEALQNFIRTSQDRSIRFYENCIQTLVERLRVLDENYVTSQYQLWRVALKKKKEAA